MFTLTSGERETKLKDEFGNAIVKLSLHIWRTCFPSLNVTGPFLEMHLTSGGIQAGLCQCPGFLELCGSGFCQADMEAEVEGAKKVLVAECLC